MKAKLFSLFMLMVSLFLLIGAHSITSLSALLFLILVWFLYEIDKIFKPLGIRRTITIAFLVFAGSLVVVDIFYSGKIMASVFGLAGKNLTLTGRTDLWADIMIEIKKHLLIGCGYKGFWITDSPKILEIYETYIWLPRSSHNGYLDIINETGLIGFFMFWGIIINYFITLVKNKEKTFWMWFIILALIENFTESILFSPGGTITFMFIFSYLSLFTNKLSKKRIIIENEMDNAYQK